MPGVAAHAAQQAQSATSQPANIAPVLILDAIRKKLGRARRTGLITAFLALMGGYLQVLSYVWGTAVLLSGLVSSISDWDFWVITGLVLMGAIVLLAVRAANQVLQGWQSGYHRDGFSGHVLPQFHSNCEAPDVDGHGLIERVYAVTKYMPAVLGLAGIFVSAWRMTLLARDGHGKVEVALWLFYITLVCSCICFLASQIMLLLCVHGEHHVRSWQRNHELFEDGCTFPAAGILQRQLLPLPDASADPPCYGLQRKMTRYHFEHIHAAALAGGLWQGMTYATPIAFLLKEYYFCRDRNLNPSYPDYSRNLLHMIQLFYEHGSALEKHLVVRWQGGEYSGDVMLVEHSFRPGP